MLFFVSVAFAACQDIEKSERPDDLIPEDKMVDIITEISLMQSARNFSKRIFENTGIKGKEYIFEKYDIDSVQFKHSNDYYADNYEIYQRIYDSVKQGFERMKVKLDTLQQQERRVKDSIAEAKRDSIGTKDSLDPEMENRVDEISDSLIQEKDSLRIENDSLPEPISRDQE
ncbi:DUF4296 domain-containing protein [Salegentibacter sp. JZCK2]|uniref:DUF4296 domain-containing protein n=1 Tax=Salegentibacter tibetensis TaxID=2873600 RepID=UPI001CC98C67|nr:DUF4296 domain-containing protein [Salegentibacter tibetensis]MBZ9728133.1 DUF4296 domain-containing protein [Salegentibacter tibetensis]